MSEQQLEIYRQTNALAEKHTYFLLGAVGACIAFAFTQSKDVSLSWPQLPLGLAILSWATSFYFGCIKINASLMTKHQNLDLLKVQAGTHPLSGRDPARIQIAVETIKEHLDKSNNRAQRGYAWQYRLLIIGVLSYFGWHMYRMYLNNVCS